MRKAIVTIIASILTVFLSGLVLYLGNMTTMVHNLFNHFGIADLSYGQYTIGAVMLGLILEVFGIVKSVAKKYDEEDDNPFN